ncbi:hypothetical protein P8452_05936 [Trifolium repens]|nr:hypothetical protein P8452_05936 [Trifolium repens]
MVKKCLLEHGRYEEKMLNSGLVKLQLECFLIPEFSPEFNIFFFVPVTPCSSLSRVTRPCGQNQALFWTRKDGKLSRLRASALEHVARNVVAGVYFTIAINSCGSPGMIRWSQFQFPFIRVPRQPSAASELVVALVSSSSANEKSYAMRWFEPLQTGVPYFVYAFVNTMEKYNVPIHHATLIEPVTLQAHT